MDAVEERKKRIEALKQRKAQLLSEGDLAKDDKSSTQTYILTFYYLHIVVFVSVIIHQRMTL